MLAPAAANVSVMLGGMSGYLFLIGGRRDDGQLIVSALACGAIAVLSALIWRWAQQGATLDPRPAPRPVRWSFALFVAALASTGAALVLRVERVFPWPLNPDTSVMYGWIFLGDACFFLYAVVRPLWSWAGAQLAAFLAYDLVLIPPLLGHIDDVPEGHELSLTLYLVALFLSAAVALYYLFVSPTTRMVRRRGKPAGQVV
jgi:hypothetical protein